MSTGTPGGTRDVHLAVLGGTRALCGSLDGSWADRTFTVSERQAACEGCLRENEALEYSGTFADDSGETFGRSG
jgi:hypothetical protein